MNRKALKKYTDTRVDARIKNLSGQNPCGEDQSQSVGIARSLRKKRTTKYTLQVIVSDHAENVVVHDIEIEIDRARWNLVDGSRPGFVLPVGSHGRPSVDQLANNRRRLWRTIITGTFSHR